MTKIAVLGSTGSIGTQTLDIVSKNEDLQVAGLAAGKNIELLEQQIRTFKPRLAAVGDPALAKELAVQVKDTDCRVVGGMEGLIELAVMEETDILVTAIVGMIGIRPTIEAICQEGYCSGKQGDIGYCRTYHHASGREKRGKNLSCGQ